MLKFINNYFTTNQFFALQNFTWGGVEISNKTPVNKEFCNKKQKI